jgi:hypothetical protein
MVLATRALEARKLKDRVRNLWGALIVSVMLIAGVFCYHEWWDPSRAGPQDNEVMVNGTDVQVFLPYDQPDGSQTYEYQPINSDMPISLACYVSLPDGLWYQIWQQRMDTSRYCARDPWSRVPESISLLDLVWTNDPKSANLPNPALDHLLTIYGHAGKLEGDKNMPGKRWPSGGVRGEVLQDPCDMAKAGLIRAQSGSFEVHRDRVAA